MKFSKHKLNGIFVSNTVISIFFIFILVLNRDCIELLNYASLFLRDCNRLKYAYDQVDVNPLGAGAISGTSFNKVREKKEKLIIIKTIFFTLGFSFVFIALGSTATFIGQFFLINSNIFRITAGVILILFSLHYNHKGNVYNYRFYN